MSFPRYESYKETGIEWLGEVPEHWELKRLKQSLRLLTGKTDRRENPVALENIESWSGRFIQTETTFEGEGIAFERGDILFGKLRPYLAKVLLAETAGEAVGDFHVMRQTKGTDSNFAQYQILNRAFIAIVDGSTFGAKMPRVSWDFLSGMVLTVPPAPEQRTIAMFLNRETAKIDELIAEQKNLIELLKEKRQAIISHAVTKGLNPTAPMKDSGIKWLGEVPEHWSLPKLKHFTSFAGGGTPSRDNPKYWNGDIPWVSPKDMKTETINGAEEYITQTGLENSSSSLRPVGRVLVVVRSGILKHTIPVAINEVPVALNQDMKALSFVDGSCLNVFFLRWVQGLNNLLLLVWAKQGATVESIEHSYLAETVIPLPPIAEQLTIVAFLDSELSKFNELTTEAKRAIELLKAARTPHRANLRRRHWKN